MFLKLSLNAKAGGFHQKQKVKGSSKGINLSKRKKENKVRFPYSSLSVNSVAETYI